MEEDKVKGRYFYLMLKENFYDSDDMVLLESMENGYLYSNILLKLYLKSLKDKGKLMYKDRIPYNVEMLAKLTRHNVDVVRRAIQIFKDMGIIEILDNGAIFMLDIENYIGKSSTEADRRRKYDRRIADEKKQLLISEKSHEKPCENSCEKSHEHTDIELDLNTDLKLELEKDIEKEPQIGEITKKVISRLNELTGSNFRVDGKATKDLIKNLLKDYKEEDILMVVNKMCYKWGTDEKMKEYLRPSTLFRRSNFENYYGMQVSKKEVTTKDIAKKMDISAFFK